MNFQICGHRTARLQYISKYKIWDSVSTRKAQDMNDLRRRLTDVRDCELEWRALLTMALIGGMVWYTRV